MLFIKAILTTEFYAHDRPAMFWPNSNRQLRSDREKKIAYPDHSCVALSTCISSDHFVLYIYCNYWYYKQFQVRVDNQILKIRSRRHASLIVTQKTCLTMINSHTKIHAWVGVIKLRQRKGKNLFHPQFCEYDNMIMETQKCSATTLLDILRLFLRIRLNENSDYA